ncbi:MULTISPECIES: phosphatidylglycerophosphatase A family protein [Rhodobacterales]|jgi:phosphatidylglycerophosphatase A|uniref:Phosphatidylglycerophosphatase A n=1 Tax=Phaeobacter gallaeciensis TaxID=60890 RepID=A0A1B0ZLL2_9RHOB|nr:MULTISPECIES: phosphatidylglycerophosphatase A [Phaeobacter]MDF1773485.1 phosphatidylglycerophosphatase A [Pseudophaeobacter sp. bin_em_oilr2.035]MEE2634480.1 phosphatidylglycerophosphatase A [Pseudomonadota bacterium]ANP35041.1 phosphatidylglycerophosphatase [Phaeobacter gallaeciensis]MDE4062737.1 phosphatidylglycerophosphatase A [Phaeobacter gallaeciensis]MDE4096407.1 phosphatidylglycerophosphatase A [Phaeobacter gallaeciensis]
MNIATAIGTVLGVGYLRPAPGTWGSLVALPLAYGLHLVGGFPLLAAMTLICTAAGLWAAAEMTRGKEDLDPSEFVMDELAGQFLALWAISYPSWAHGIDITALWPGWVTAFVLFRLFDILKPGPVGWADRKKGAVGVMMDDVIAGIFAAIGVALLAGLSHGVLGL